MNNKNFKTIMIIAIVAIIAVVGVGYAALSTDLIIGGSATVKSSSWKVRFLAVSDANPTGKATQITKPVLSSNDTHIGDYVVQLSRPGDSIYYIAEVKNEGNIDAAVSSVTVDTPQCTGNGANAAQDASNVCDNLTYTLTYSDGSAINTGDVVHAGETKSLKLSLSYSSSVTADKLPKNDVAVSNLEATVVYAQN